VSKIISFLLVLLFTLGSLSGCIRSEVETVELESEFCTEGNMPEWQIGCTLPSFDYIDQNGTHWNESSANGTGRWVAYFSASWCIHCKPTIGALDEAIMPNHLLVMNKHESNESSNMTNWHNLMEGELNRSLNRPFLHAPPLSENLSIASIPHILLIENNTILSARVGLWGSVEEMSIWFNATSHVSGYTNLINEP